MRMLKENAANLKMATIETAKQAERGIVDIETLTDLPKVQDINDDTQSSNPETAEVESELSDNQISSFELPTPDEIGIDFSTIQ